MTKKKEKNLKPVFTSILITLAIYTGAIFIFFYVSGWRIDLMDQSIKKTGVLTVESSPILADIYVDDEYRGRTNKSMTLDIGEYNIKVSKEGYFDWNKKVDIIEEKSTPVFPFLIKSELKEENIYNSETLVKKYWADGNNNNLVFLTETETEFNLFYYSLNSTFLPRNSLPTNILTIPKINEDYLITDINLKLSPSGDLAILKISKEDPDDIERFIIPTKSEIPYISLDEYSIDLKDFTDFQV